MAKKALVIKAARKPKFAVRGYTRCQRCGRPKADLPAPDGPPGRAPRREQVLMVERFAPHQVSGRHSPDAANSRRRPGWEPRREGITSSP
jgi:hypothetical protein